MREEYRYRKHIRWGQYIIPALFGGVALFIVAGCLITMGFAMLSDAILEPTSHVKAAAGGVMGILTLVVLAEGALAWYLYYRLAGVRFVLDDEAATYVYRGGEKRIPYDDIVRIKTPSIRYFGGWLKVVSQSDTIRLTLSVENMSKLVRRLKEELDRRGLEERYDRAELLGFLKTATFLDQSCERLFRSIWRIALLSLTSLGVVIGLGLPAGLYGVGVIALLEAVLLWPLVPYLATEFIFGRRLKRLADEETFTCPDRDVPWEKRITRRAFLTGSLVFLGLSVVFYLFLLTAP